MNVENYAKASQELYNSLVPAGLHGTSNHRRTLIRETGEFNSRAVSNRDPDYTYYALLDFHELYREPLHPLFPSFSIELARTFAQQACENDRQQGIDSQPVLMVIRNPQPETSTRDYKLVAGTPSTELRLVSQEAREKHTGILERVIGEIHDVDFKVDEDIFTNHLRIIRQLIDILKQHTTHARNLRKTIDSGVSQLPQKG